VHFN